MLVFRKILHAYLIDDPLWFSVTVIAYCKHLLLLFFGFVVAFVVFVQSGEYLFMTLVDSNLSCCTCNAIHQFD